MLSLSPLHGHACYDEVALLIQLLSFSDKRLSQFLPFCVIVVIIDIYTHFAPY